MRESENSRVITRIIRKGIPNQPSILTTNPKDFCCRLCTFSYGYYSSQTKTNTDCFDSCELTFTDRKIRELNMDLRVFHSRPCKEDCTHKICNHFVKFTGE